MWLSKSVIHVMKIWKHTYVRILKSARTDANSKVNLYYNTENVTKNINVCYGINIKLCQTNYIIFSHQLFLVGSILVYELKLAWKRCTNFFHALIQHRQLFIILKLRVHGSISNSFLLSESITRNELQFWTQDVARRLQTHQIVLSIKIERTKPKRSTFAI